MVQAADAIAGHRATRSAEHPSARGGRSWGGIGGNWRHTARLRDPLLAVGDSSPHAWICRVGTAKSPRCRSLHVPEAAIFADQWATAVTLASIGCATVVVAIGAKHIVTDRRRAIVALALRVRLDAHECLLEDAGGASSRGQGAPTCNPTTGPCR